MSPYYLVRVETTAGSVYHSAFRTQGEAYSCARHAARRNPRVHVVNPSGTVQTVRA